MNLPKRAVSESKLGSPPRGGEREESAFPQQQPIFMGGKLPLKPGLLLEATRDFPAKGWREVPDTPRRLFAIIAAFGRKPG